MRMKIFYSVFLLLSLRAFASYAQVDLPAGGADPYASAVSTGKFNGNISKTTISIKPGRVKKQLHLSILPASNSNTKASAPNREYGIVIVNNKNSVVKSFTINQQKLEIDVSDLLAGYYTIQVINHYDKSAVAEAGFLKL